MWTELAKNAALIGAPLASSGFVELSTVPSNFRSIDPRGRYRVWAAPNGKIVALFGAKWMALIPEGFGSTDADSTELTMLPAIRPLIEPPFCASGSTRSESGETTGFVIVGGVEPKNTPDPEVNGLDD